MACFAAAESLPRSGGECRTLIGRRDSSYADGTPGGIRTPDLLLRRQLLYPAELLARIIQLKNERQRAQIKAQRSGSDLEKEKGGCGYGVFSAWSKTEAQRSGFGFERRNRAAQPRKSAGAKRLRFPSRAERISTMTWLGWQDSNLRIPESKSGALPLGDSPVSLRPAASTSLLPYWKRALSPCGRRKGILYGVSDGTRTHGLQSHNLTR